MNKIGNQNLIVTYAHGEFPKRNAGNDSDTAPSGGVTYADWARYDQLHSGCNDQECSSDQSAQSMLFIMTLLYEDEKDYIYAKYRKLREKGYSIREIERIIDKKMKEKMPEIYENRRTREKLIRNRKTRRTIVPLTAYEKSLYEAVEETDRMRAARKAWHRAEMAKIQEETDRIQAEGQGSYLAENAKIQAENDRIQAEFARIQAENDEIQLGADGADLTLVWEAGDTIESLRVSRNRMESELALATLQKNEAEIEAIRIEEAARKLEEKNNEQRQNETKIAEGKYPKNDPDPHQQSARIEEGKRPDCIVV
jgi:hypothetical protein